jgi:hypothetical protein
LRAFGTSLSLYDAMQRLPFALGIEISGAVGV